MIVLLIGSQYTVYFGLKKTRLCHVCTCTDIFCLLSVVCVGLAPIVLEYHINERECGMIKLLENKPL